MGKQLEATALKSELNSLLHLLHNDSLKLAKLTNNDVAIKATNPVLLAKIKTKPAQHQFRRLAYHADPQAH